MSTRSSSTAGRAFDTLVTWLNGGGVVWAFALMFLISADIIGRAAFDHPLVGVTEMVSLSLVACVFLQLGYAVLRRDALELHLFDWPHARPDNSIAGCFIRIADAPALHREWSALGFAVEGTPSVGPVGPRFWGMNEFTVVDPSGNLLRVGSPIRDLSE